MKSTSPPTNKLDPPRSATNRELILLRTPLDTSSSPIDPQQHQRGLPSRRRRSPDVGIPILRASDDTIGIRCPGDSRDQLIVLYPRQLRLLIGITAGVPQRESAEVPRCRLSWNRSALRCCWGIRRPLRMVRMTTMDGWKTDGSGRG